MSLLTIVFTDVVESSATKRDISLGRDSRERDHAYLEKVQNRHFNLIRQCCADHSGKEVSTMGDAFYLAFDDPIQAVRCTVQIQRKLAEQPIETPLGPLRLRVGIHTGLPEFYEGSWHGTDVDTAARVEAAATARQILLSSTTYELVRHMADVKFHSRGEFALKGVERIALWEADWDGNGPRPTAVPPLPSKERHKIIGAGAAFLVLLLISVAAVAYLIHSELIRSKGGIEQTVFPARHRPSVAVLGFKNLTAADVSWLSEALTEYLTTELASGSALRTIPSEDVSAAKTDLSLAPASAYGKATLERVKKILGTDYVVAGSYSAAGSTPSDPIEMDVWLQNASSGETVSTFQGSGTVGAVSELIRKAGATLRQKLSVQEPSEKDAQQTSATLPADPEAMRLYSDGVTKVHTLDALGAKDSLESAIQRAPQLAVAHEALAGAWQILGYDDKAKAEAKTALDLSGALPDEDRKSIEGRYRQLNGQWDDAIHIYQSLWDIFDDEPNYALELARVQIDAGKGQDALSTLANLRKRPGMNDDPRVDLTEALAAESLSDVKLQRASATSAAEKAKQEGSRLIEAHADWQLCSALYAMGDFKNGEKACQASNNAAPFDDEIRARSQTVWANILEAEGQIPEAVSMRRQALETAEKIGSQKDIVGAEQNLADMLELQGNSQEARSYYTKAMQTAESIGDSFGLVQVQNDFAGQLAGNGDYAGAEALFQRSLQTARMIGDKGGIAMALENLGLLQLERGDVAQALENTQQALSLQKEAGLEVDSTYALNLLGDILLAKGDLPGARKNYQEALNIATKQNVPAAIASSRLGLAGLYIETRDYQQAETLARQAADEFSSEKQADAEAEARNTLADALLMQGKVPEARAEFDRAAALPSHDYSIRMLLSITGAQLKAREGDQAASLKQIDAVVMDAEKEGQEVTRLKAILAKAEIEAASNPSEAQKNFQIVADQARNKGLTLISEEATDKQKKLLR